ncbi:bacillithiol system redox-active protein YtxJ [Salinibacter ruber]|jgi:bacillithiol system protein YtxJ|uniref:Bacillithiol system protein YtxJ n=1 Tax=Salinibacter ruber TaxID=146919 RepID=A0A9X2QBC5_9BACT|nr:bacillithiol system redox-active protein YtxJ [Salinibacter ruber]MCS3660197.1 bacillithiol system protein YtxJ [Salinibacter ruber]MCS3709882.1 bacillithiol system protein YtxJ [Salinibacter ruber]MCS4170290.1 bacillithiol system protein YtxJ [Salinibacter ruber]
MCDPAFLPLTSESEWSEAKAKSSESPVLLFKHTLECPVSETAARELRRLARSEDVTVYRLVVQEHGPLSSQIAEALEIDHETPQAILLHKHTPLFEASHFDITADSFRDVLRNLSLR